MPPTISLQYRFDTAGNFQPYIGAGVNYTIFSSEKIGLPNADLELDESVGLALQVGFDYEINDRMIFNAVLRAIDIETDAKLDGVDLTTVKIDPIAIGLGIGWTF